MRSPTAAAACLLLLAMGLAGCTSPFTQYPTSSLPEVRASFDLRPYDSDDNGANDGIAMTLRSAQPPPPLVGSDVVIGRNGDDNVTVWRCPQRESLLCQSNRGPLSWDVGETLYIRGLPGQNRLNIVVRERFVYNTTLRVDETRDTEVWAVLAAKGYDRDGNRTLDGIEISLVESDKAPFRADEVQVLVNKVEATIFRDPSRVSPFDGLWNRGSKLFVDGFIGDNRVELFIKSTRYDLGTYPVGE